MEQEKIQIAIQKGGRLSEKSAGLLSECGIKLENGFNKLKSQASNFPLEALFLRDDDIPEYVETGVAQLGIVGENVLLEENSEVEIVARLGFGKCRMSIAMPRGYDYKGIPDLNGKKIATSYPKILQKFFDENSITAEIHIISGSVEIAPGIGLADGVFDIVSTGSTLAMNGLREVETVLKSEAILIANKNLSAENKVLLEQILFRLEAVQAAKGNKYILLNTPNTKVEEITNLLPGLNAPTILPLAREGWSSMHSVIKEDQFWSIIGKLKTAGAEGILVVPIEKMFS